MATSELDIHHITAICDRTAERTGITGYSVTDTSAAVRVRAPSTEAAGLLQASLVRVGYTVDRPHHFGRRDELTVPGWSRHHLAARITALRQEINRLDATRRETAATAVDRIASGRTTPQNVLADIGHELREDAAARTGVAVPVRPRQRPTDPDIARLLRTARRLEQHVATLIQRHAITAGLAAHRYDDYSAHTSPELARAAAIHDAYLTGRGDHHVIGAGTSSEPPAPGADATVVAANDFPATAREATGATPHPPSQPAPPTPTGTKRSIQ